MTIDKNSYGADGVRFADCGGRLVHGKNLDKLNIAAGMEMLAQTGYDDERTKMVIEYALQRWARGEEGAAERGAIDSKWHGIDFTSWRMVLAAAMAGAQP